MVKIIIPLHKWHDDFQAVTQAYDHLYLNVHLCCSSPLCFVPFLSYGYYGNKKRGSVIWFYFLSGITDAQMMTANTYSMWIQAVSSEQFTSIDFHVL